MRVLGTGNLPVKWLIPLLALHEAAELEPFVRAVQGLIHTAVPPLRAVGVMFHPFEWQFPLLFSEKGEEEDWRKWLDCAPEDDIWLQRWQKLGNPGPHHRIVRHTDHTPDSVLVRSKIYRKLMKLHRIRYGVAMLAWDGTHPLMLVQVLRSTGHGDFTDAEMRRLRLLHPHVASAVKRLFETQRGHAAHLSLERFIAASPAGMILVDWHLRVLHCNRSGADLCREWQHGAAQARVLKQNRAVELPESLRAECERFRRECSEHPLTLKGQVKEWVKAHPEQAGLRCRIQCFSGAPLNEPLFLLCFERVTAGAVATASRASVEGDGWAGLTEREREIARLVRAGQRNGEIAKTLHKSPATVRNQLHSVFEKLGVKTRTELAARVRA